MAESPFLPGTKLQYAWDSTSIGYLKTCPRLYYYKIIEGWNEKEDSVHLRFGLEYHQALQDYDTSCIVGGIKHDDAVHDVVRELLVRTADFDPDHSTKTRLSLLRTVVWYLDKFQNDPAKTYVLANGKPAVELSFRFELDWGPQHQGEVDTTGDYIHSQPYILSGHLDRVVEYQNELFVMDRKTASSSPTSWYFSQYEPDNQMSLYTLAGQVVLGSPIRGVIIDAAQIKEDETEFGRGFTYRTPAQVKEWLDDLKIWLAQAESYAVAGHWPQNDKACGSYRSERDNRIGCPFRSICSKDPGVRDRFLDGNFVQLPEEERWNPLKSR